MKNTKTTIRELSARYRDILKKCFFLNAVAIGLFAATSASAAINVVTDVSGIGVSKDVANIESAVQSAARTAVSADLADSTSAIYSAVKAEAIKEISDSIKNTVYSDGTYTATNSAYRADEKTTLSVKDGIPTAAQYQFDFDGNGDMKTLNGNGDGTNMSKTLIAVNGYDTLAGATSGTLTGDATYNTAKIARDNAQLYTVGDSTYQFKLGETTEDDPTLATALASGKYVFYSEKTLGNVALSTTNVTATGEGEYADATANLAFTGYSWEDWAGASHVLTTTAPNPASYAFTNSHGEDDNLGNYYDSTTDKFSFPTEEMAYVSTAMAHYDTDKTNYNGEYSVWTTDNGAYQAAVGNYNTERAAFDALVAAYDADEGYNAGYTAATTAYNEANGRYQAADSAFDTDVSNYGITNTAYTTYKDSVQIAVDARAEAAIDRVVGVANTAAAEDPSNATGLFKDVEDLQAADTAINAKIGDLNDTRWGDDKTVGEVVKNIADIIGSKAESETWEGTFDGDKSVMSAVLDNKTAIGNEETRAKNAEAALDAKIGTITEDGTYVKAYVAATTEDPAVGTVAQNLVALDTAVATLNGGVDDAGSVLNSVKQTAQNAVYNKETSYAAGTIGAAIKGNTTEIAAINTKLGTEDVDTTGNMAPTSGSVQTVIGGLNKLDDALTTERTARTDADAAINAKIGGSFDSTNTVAKAISDETTRATGVEAAINAKIGEGFDADNTVAQAIADLKQDTSDTFDDVVGTTGELADLESLSFFKAKNSGSVGGTAPGDSSVAELLTNLNGNLETEFARVDSRINKLETKLEKGLAANNALAGLVPLDHVHRTQVSAALGGYKNNQALAVGAFHYINDRTLLNAGAAYGGNDSVSYKVGVTFGF